MKKLNELKQAQYKTKFKTKKERLKSAFGIYFEGPCA
jgi:hypothetical protein